LGGVIVWWSLDRLGDDKKIFGIISVIVVSEPDITLLRESAVSRIINTLIGSALGLACMHFIGINFWSLIVAVTSSVLISTSFKKYPTSWKLAPVTVAIIIIPAITESENYKIAMRVALERTGEVLYGSLVAFILGLVFGFLRTRFINRFISDDE
jgi:uncharacterized membrane protein YccC